MKVMLRRVVLRFARDRKANIAVIFALTMVPIIFLLGMTLDYTQAVRKRGQLDAAADAAAIAAVRPAMLTQSDKTVVQATAAAVFAAKANLPGLTATPTADDHRHGFRPRANHHGFLHREVRQQFPQRSRQADLGRRRLRDGEGVERAQHEFLSADG
ncbi:hypothetical protein ABIF75_010089 [Bradyrhizobium japonicum]